MLALIMNAYWHVTGNTNNRAGARRSKKYQHEHRQRIEGQADTADAATADGRGRLPANITVRDDQVYIDLTISETDSEYKDDIEDEKEDIGTDDIAWSKHLAL